MTILLLSGYKQSGKDTAANYLVQDRGFKRAAFADSLKNDVSTFFNLSRKDMDDQSTKESPILDRPVQSYDPFSKLVNEFLFKEFRTRDGKQPLHFNWFDGEMVSVETDGQSIEIKELFWTPRAACIFVGSVGRSFNADHWVDRALTNVGDINKPIGLQNVVVSDFRYKSEYNRVIELFGKDIVKTVRIDRFDTVNSTDPSERNLDDFEFDVRIENKGTLQEFIAKINEVV